MQYFVYSYNSLDEKKILMDSFHKIIHVTMVITVYIFRSTKHHHIISVHSLLFHSSFSMEPPFGSIWSITQNLAPVFPMFSDSLSYFLPKFTIVFSQSFGESFFGPSGFGSSVDISRIKIGAYWYKGLWVISAERVR